MVETPLISRRSLLVSAATGMVANAAANTARLHVGCQTNAWNIDPNNMDSLLEVLGNVRSLRFEGFETGFRNLQAQFQNPQPARERLQNSGLRFFGIHVFLSSYDPETSIAPRQLLKSVVDGGASLGAERLIVSGHSTPEAARLTKKAAALDRIARYSKEKGLKLGYHNHQPEFQKNRFQIEALLKQTDAGLVHLIVDAGH
ncbi:MAG: sugar phosphate isomerase/epimerase, partial [Acidobacteriaceae bacterium]|nr:sugar phosphate isomerase/epimerase [Acidobacteriaceae bacterium]